MTLFSLYTTGLMTDGVGLVLGIVVWCVFGGGGMGGMLVTFLFFSLRMHP